MLFLSSHRDLDRGLVVRSMLAIPLFFPAFTVAAEENNHKHLEIIHVEAVPLSGEFSQPIDVLEGEELELRKSSSSLGELLSEELGVQNSSFGPGAGRPVIRGQSGARIRTLEEGVGTLDVATISADHAVPIEPLLVERVEILRGPSTLLYGSSAVGGVVNVINNRIPEYVPESLEGALEYRFDTASNLNAGVLSLNAGAGDFAFHVDGVARASKDYRADIGVIENSTTDTDQYSLGGSWITDRGMIGVAFNRQDSLYGIPGGDEMIDLEQQRYDIKAELDSPFSGFENVKFRLGYNDYNHVEGEIEEGEFGVRFDNEALETRLELTHEPLWQWHGVIGLQYLDRDFSAQNLAEESFVTPTKADGLGLFVMEERQFDAWDIQLGARIERRDYDNQDAGKVDFDLYSLSAGGVWHFSDEHVLDISFTRAQRAPEIEELFADGPHEASATFERGDINLEKETANNIELAFKKVDGDLQWQVGVFANYVEDYVYLEFNDANGDGIADVVNEEGMTPIPGEDTLTLLDYRQEDAWFYGVEAEVEIPLSSGETGKSDLRLFTDYVRAELDSGQDLPRISPLRIGANLDYKFQQWQMGVDAIRVFKQSDISPLETATEGYTMLNADLKYTTAAFGRTELEVFFRLTNLLDEDARQHTSFLKDDAPLAGRSLATGIRLSF